MCVTLSVNVDKLLTGFSKSHIASGKKTAEAETFEGKTGGVIRNLNEDAFEKKVHTFVSL